SPSEADANGDFYDDISIEEIDDDLEPHARTESFVADTGADEDHPTMTTDAFLVAASAQSDQGRRRKNNEDSCLLMKNEGIFFVADGMGGYEGGEIASQLAVDTIEAAFKEKDFTAKVHADVPPRPTELAQAMQAANLAIWEVATDDPKLRGMGTTLVGARFALRKNRVYIGHVGDSRCYRFRGGVFRRLTVDHTLEALGHKGPRAKHLFRAVGIGSEMDIDIITAVPKLGDIYLFCSDGLTKMVSDDGVRSILVEHEADLDVACEQLVAAANEAGGKDNTTVVIVAVRSIEDALAEPSA
ncbi:MAG: serine/threonine-protein phosphatase, partial [Deltaproteobacteria bacterium]